MNNKVGLVLEGGGFRGLYTAGVLHYFQKIGIEFPYIVAVSMGASNATNYLSKQTQRNLDVPYTFVTDKRYISYQRLITKGELFGMDFIFNEVPNKYIPFDTDAFSKSQKKLVYVTTNCETGLPYYIPNNNNQESFKALEASTSLPFASKMVKLNNKLLLDGGISDPIPIDKALKDGYEKLVVVLTQPQTYRKNPFRGKLIAKWMYKKYPKLIDAILSRHEVYNKQLDQIEELARKGSAFVIRPAKVLPVKRTEKNKEKLKEAFDLGYHSAEQLQKQLLQFIG